MKVRGGKETWDFDGSIHDPVAAISADHCSPLRNGRPKAGFNQDSRHSLQQYWRFLCAGLTRHSQTGAILPSQRFLIDRMIAPVPADYRGEVVELGAGTGVLTFRLAERCPFARVLACEINPNLAEDLRGRVAAAGLSRRVRVSTDPAQQLLSRISQRGSKAAEFIVSGIPLGNLVKQRAIALVGAIYDALVPNGMYIQFQYSLMDRRKIRNKFAQLQTGFVLFNVPPAFIYYARR